jgi:beta-lactamase class A
MSEERSYAQRGRGRLPAAAVLLAAALTVAGPAAAEAKTWPSYPYPARARVAAATEFASVAPGTVSFAVIDSSAGVRGYEPDRVYSSASVSKALLLAAQLQDLRGETLDGETRSLLESMITVSDNDAASSIYARVGDAGMEEAARRAGMRSFDAIPGYWGGAQVTAADLARFFFRLDGNLAGRHREFGERLLQDITSTQRWGIPAAAPDRWQVYFKGGWRPAGATENSGSVTHQAALLRGRDGRRVGLAILTDLSPGSSAYAVLEGITERLLREPPRGGPWVAP